MVGKPEPILERTLRGDIASNAPHVILWNVARKSPVVIIRDLHYAYGFSLIFRASWEVPIVRCQAISHAFRELNGWLMFSFGILRLLHWSRLE